MAVGVARHVKDLGRDAFEEVDPVAVGHFQIERRKAVGIGGGTNYAGVWGHEVGHACDVVVMVMGQQDVGQDEAASVEFGGDWSGFGCVDEGRGTAIGGNQQIGVVVGQARDCDDLRLGHGNRGSVG